MENVRVCTLGDLSISFEGKQIQTTDNRSRKLWLLLAYLLTHRKNPIPNETFIDLLWSDNDGSSNPSNALKTMFHRLRTILDQLGEGVGHRLILRHRGGYILNPQVNVILDVDEFEDLCLRGQASLEDAVRLDLYTQALALYQGDFLPKLSAEPWVIPLSAYYHNLYLQTVYATLPLLDKANDPHQATLLCRRAVEIEPYDETLYAHLMRHLLAIGEQQAAVLAYEHLNQLLSSQFGVSPSEPLRQLHREALRETGEHYMDLQMITQTMLDRNLQSGALYCEFDFFQAIYSAETRMISRNGNVLHVAMITATTASGEPLPKRSLDRCMDNLRQLLCDLLRRGDIVSRCSASQYILLLPNANYENATMVLDRIVRQFGRKYPHSPAFLRHSIQPIIPV